MLEITIRPARPSEREALEALQRRASLANTGDREALLAHPEAIHLPTQDIESGRVHVAQRNRQPIGFAVILCRGDGDVELDGLFVDPAYWRKGVGRTLVDHCVALAKRSGARRMHVLGNPHALRFYESCGFREMGTVRAQFGDAIALILDFG